MTIERTDLAKHIQIRRIDILNGIFKLADLARSGKMDVEKVALETTRLSGAQEELDLIAKQYGVSEASKIHFR